MASLGNITRRGLLGVFGLAAGGAAFGYWYGSRPWANPLQPEEGTSVFNPWLTISADNIITVITPRAEMGQGIHTTLVSLVAEELNTGIDKIRIGQGVADGAYYNAAMLEEAGPFTFYDQSFLARAFAGSAGWAGKALGLQGTGGSTSARDAYEKMRIAGAAARLVLIEAAAARLAVPASELEAKDGVISHGTSGKSVTFGEVAADAAKLRMQAEPPLKDKKDWTILGKAQKRVDLAAKVTGAPIYGIDMQLPDMLYGTVRMAPAFGATVKTSNLTAALAMDGVMAVIPLATLTGNGFGVIATNTWTAFQAAAAIEVEWSIPDTPADSVAIDEALKAGLDAPDFFSLRDDGDVVTAFADAPAGSIVEADYSVPFLAHAPMEPMNATALFKDGRLTLWTPDQIPTLCKFACANALDIKMADVTVNTTHLGGGFGRRLEADYSVYAALIAKSVPGRPIKVTWTREEDMTHDFYRPAAMARVKARIGADGLPQAMDIKVASPSIIRSILARTMPSMSPAGPDKLMVTGTFDQPYACANYRVSGAEVRTRVPVGMWRSVGNSINGHFHELFIDEIAAKSGKDPVAMRIAMLKDFPWAVKVVEKAAEMSGWGTAAAPGTAKGFAFCHSFGSWVAEVIQVSGSIDAIKIDKVWIAADLGTVLDPGIVEAQLTSGVIFGLSAAMMQEITFKDGGAVQQSFPDFDAMRIHQAPEFEVALLENAPWMGGAGEIGTPPAAPALANAIFALTGQRLRSLPLSKHVKLA